MGQWLETFIEERPRLTLLGLFGVFMVVLGVVTIAPAFISFLLAVAIAGAWCWWLEKHAPIAPTSAT
jgi:hypothetical protein